MQKLIVFSPIIIFFLVFLALIVGFGSVVIKLVLKGKKNSWQGKLIDKMHKTREEFDNKKINHFYTLVFETQDGKQIKVGTSKQVYDGYKIGDRAIKKSGELGFKKAI